MLKNEFDKLAAALGSPFAAVNYVAKLARIKRLSVNNQILESEAISWVLTGEKPPIRPSYAKQQMPNISMIDDLLSCVDDEEVCSSVRDSYETSLNSRHLIYCYHNDLDEYRQGRVRILTRMIWYNIQTEKEDM